MRLIYLLEVFKDTECSWESGGGECFGWIVRYAICGAYVELEIYQSSGGNFFCINMCWKVNSVDCLQVQTETSFTKAENVFASAERTWDAEEESFARFVLH